MIPLGITSGARPGRKLSLLLAGLIVSSGLVVVASAPAHAAATAIRARVTIDVSQFQRLAREENDIICGNPEYEVHTDIGMFEKPRVAQDSRLYENASIYEAWTVVTDGYIDLTGVVTTYTTPDYPAQEWISGTIYVEEHDGDEPLCSGPDDPIDINPQPGSNPTALTYLIEPSSGRVYAYNYLDPLLQIGRLYEPSGTACRLGPGKVCTGYINTRAPDGWAYFHITLLATT